MGAALAAAGGLLLVYWDALAGYLRDQHFQEHFLYLWVFLALALARSLRGPFHARFSFADARDRVGLGLVALAVLLLAASETAGSTSGVRTSLVLFLTGCAVLVVAGWTIHRCLMHGLLMQLCFGFPYAIYYPVTSKLQWGVASMMALPAKLGLANYVVDGAVVRFPDYQLGITPDCSGLGQLLTFVGIASLGVLSSARDRKRTLWLLVLAVALSWLSNLARVGMFVFFIAIGWHAAVDNPTWHALLGFLAFLPFVALLVWQVLRTHRPLPPTSSVPAATGRWPVLLLVGALLAVHVTCAREEEREFPAPAYFAALEHAPGYRLQMRGPSEAVDRVAYVTPWLINARFRDDAGREFDLFHYATRSRSHLCVHKVADCVTAPHQRVRYEGPVLVDGQPWWRIALDGVTEEDSTHVYFAFEIGGQRYDDSAATRFEVFRQRLLGLSWEVRLTRVMFPGRLPPEPGAEARAVLAWLGGLTKAPS